MREEMRALRALLTRVADKMEAIVAQFERTPDGDRPVEPPRPCLNRQVGD
jgi:hypothetical protein